MIPDEFDLKRFLDAQEPVYEQALAILRGGAMCTPYMDFIFPRLRLIADPVPQPFAIGSLEEAQAYLAFPTLGNRYRECVEALSWLVNESAIDVFGVRDAVRLQASLTLFAEAGSEQLLRIMLSIWFNDQIDEATILRLQALG